MLHLKFYFGQYSKQTITLEVCLLALHLPKFCAKAITDEPQIVTVSESVSQLSVCQLVENLTK